MMASGPGRQAEIIRLTKAAAEAAEQGNWDIVIQCYQDRGVLLSTTQEPVRDAEVLLKLDERIQDRAHTAQAVLTSLLSEAASTRRRLQGFRQQLSALSLEPESISVDA